MTDEPDPIKAAEKRGAGDDPVVGHWTMRDGSHRPLYKSEAAELWAGAVAAKAKRERDMPDERSAIVQLFEAYTRLTELGWKDPVYAPKDGSRLELIEAGSTGIHSGYYSGDWPEGGWWIDDGDMSPSRPVLARPARL